jgi:cell division transport system permease protein
MLKEKLLRVIKAGWTNFKRNSYVSFGTTGVMALVLLLFLGLIGLNFLSTTIVSTLQSKVDISVYFKTQASEDEIGTVKSDLQKLGTVTSIEYISRQQALDDFKNRHAGDPLIQESLAQLEDNPLQASLNIKAGESSNYASIVSFLEANKFRTLIDKINFYENEQVINRVENISKALQNWGFISTLILSLIAVLVTFNTIRLTIYNQKQEIEIMRLVGGSNWYIKGPYLIEGAVYGAFAALIALVVFYPILHFASPKVATLMPGVSLMSYFVSNVWQFAPLMLGVGILLGVASSFIAIRRFLKV